VRAGGDQPARNRLSTTAVTANDYSRHRRKELAVVGGEAMSDRDGEMMRVPSELKDRIYKHKARKETYGEVLTRILDDYEGVEDDE